MRALDGLDLTVGEGEVHGFLGPNGAGKSTTIRVLLGLARADGGQTTLFGRDPWKDAVDLHRRIAYVPGDVSLWPNLSGGEAIDLLARLRGGTTDRALYAQRKKRLLDVFQLDPTKKGRAYSKGNRQKVALIAAFATPADLYILDEPTSGLDPLMEASSNPRSGRVAAEGATVLLSSHILSEVEQLCDRVTIIRAGRTVETGTLAELRHLTRTEVSFRAEGVGEEALAHLPRGPRAAVRDGRVRLTADSDRSPRSWQHSPAWTSAGSPSRRPRSKSSSCATMATTPPASRPFRRRRRDECDHPDARVGATSEASPRPGAITTLRALLRQRFRRDRWQLLIWVLSIGLLAAFSAASLQQTYGSALAPCRFFVSPSPTRPSWCCAASLRARAWPALTFFEIFTFLALLAGLMNTFLAVRHSRAEEESGRAELVAPRPRAGCFRPSRPSSMRSWRTSCSPW